MLKTVSAVVVLGLWAATAGAAEDPAKGIEWVYSFEEATELALKTNRHIVADFFTPT